MPPTDFSFVQPEGWEMLGPQFDKAESKLDEKARRGEISDGFAKKLKKLMWEKYERWSSGRGKMKEDQTVLQRQHKSASLQKEARVSIFEVINFLNLISSGEIGDKITFIKTLKKYEIGEEEFFQRWAQDIKKNPSKWPEQSVSAFNEILYSWGFDPEMEQVMEAVRDAKRPEMKVPGAGMAPTRPEAPAAPAAPAKPELRAPAAPAGPTPPEARRPRTYRGEPCGCRSAGDGDLRTAI